MANIVYLRAVHSFSILKLMLYTICLNSFVECKKSNNIVYSHNECCINY